MATGTATRAGETAARALCVVREYGGRVVFVVNVREHPVGWEARPLCLQCGVHRARKTRTQFMAKGGDCLYLVSPGGLSSWPRLSARAQGKQSPGLHHLQRAGPALGGGGLARGDVWRSLGSSCSRPILARRACDGHTTTSWGDVWCVWWRAWVGLERPGLSWPHIQSLAAHSPRLANPTTCLCLLHFSFPSTD